MAGLNVGSEPLGIEIRYRVVVGNGLAELTTQTTDSCMINEVSKAGLVTDILEALLCKFTKVLLNQICTQVQIDRILVLSTKSAPIKSHLACNLVRAPLERGLALCVSLDMCWCALCSLKSHHALAGRRHIS